MAGNPAHTREATDLSGIGIAPIHLFCGVKKARSGGTVLRIMDLSVIDQKLTSARSLRQTSTLCGTSASDTHSHPPGIW